MVRCSDLSLFWWWLKWGERKLLKTSQRKMVSLLLAENVWHPLLQDKPSLTFIQNVDECLGKGLSKEKINWVVSRIETLSHPSLTVDHTTFSWTLCFQPTPVFWIQILILRIYEGKIILLTVYLYVPTIVPSKYSQTLILFLTKEKSINLLTPTKFHVKQISSDIRIFIKHTPVPPQYCGFSTLYQRGTPVFSLKVKFQFHLP